LGKAYTYLRMDDLVPKGVTGSTRLAMQITCALAMTLFVAVLLIIIEGSILLLFGKAVSGGWLVVGAGFLLTTGTTGVLVRRVMKNELESKHVSLLVAQAVSLVVLSAGFLAVINATDTPYYYIGGAAGPIIMENGARPRGGPLQIMLNNNQSNVITIGQTACQSFLFPTKVAQDVGYSVTMKTQPSGSLCTVNGGSGIASKDLLGNDGIRVNCQAAWLVGGVILFNGGANWPQGLVLAINGGTDQILIQSPVDPWYFPTPILHYSQYSVVIVQQPPSLTCVLDRSAGIALAPVVDVQVKCTLVPTPAPPG